MKKKLFIIRVVLSPIVFLFSLLAITVFPGIICFIIGLSELFLKAIGVNVDDSYIDLISFSTIVFWYPFKNTQYFIFEGKFIE